MNNIYFKLEEILNEDISTYEISKVSGSPALPTDFLEKHNLENDLFVMQINLTEISKYNKLLPSSGMIYIFLDVESFPYIPKVIYTTEEITTVYDDINEGFEDYTKVNGYKLKVTNSLDDGHYLFGEVDVDLDIEQEFDITGYKVLLSIDSLNLPYGVLRLGSPDNWYIFLIKEDDLINKDFSKVKFIDFGS